MGRFHGREIARRSRVSVGGANQMLHSFSLGWLLEEKRGRMLFYRANNEDPTVRQLKVSIHALLIGGSLSNRQSRFRRTPHSIRKQHEWHRREGERHELFLLTDDKKEVSDMIHKFNAKSQKRVAPIILDTQGFSRLRREDSAIFDRISKGIVLWQKD